jgi:hypothetical protein
MDVVRKEDRLLLHVCILKFDSTPVLLGANIYIINLTIVHNTYSGVSIMTFVIYHGYYPPDAFQSLSCHYWALYFNQDRLHTMNQMLLTIETLL